MQRVTQLIGRTFGLLHVRHFSGIHGRHAVWCCMCACLPTCHDCKGAGCRVKVRGTKLLTGKQVSCGCSRTDSRKRTEAARKVPVKIRRSRAKCGGAARAGSPSYSLTISRAADMMAVAPAKVIELSREGLIRTIYREKKRLMVSAADVAAWIDSQQRNPQRCPMGDVVA